MSLPSVVLSVSSLVCDKMDGIRGSQKSDPLWKTQGDREPRLIYPGFGVEYCVTRAPPEYGYQFQDLLGVLSYLIFKFSVYWPYSVWEKNEHQKLQLITLPETSILP